MKKIFISFFSIILVTGILFSQGIQSNRDNSKVLKTGDTMTGTLTGTKIVAPVGTFQNIQISTATLNTSVELLQTSVNVNNIQIGILGTSVTAVNNYQVVTASNTQQIIDNTKWITLFSTNSAQINKLTNFMVVNDTTVVQVETNRQGIISANNLIMSTMTTMTEVFRATSTILNDRVTILENAAPAPGGGGSSTSTIVLQGGGDVFLANTVFIPITGAFFVCEESYTITGIRAYNIYTSTCASTFYNVAKTTETGNVTVWADIFTTNVEVSTGSKHSSVSEFTLVTSQSVNKGDTLALHINGISTIGGTLPAEYGVEIRGYKP
jgi:hypothetical protein